MDWNSDGSLLAYSSSGEACYTSESSSTYEIQVLHVETHAIVKTITGSKCPITSLDWSPDDSQILAASISGRGIDIWDVATSQSVNIKVVTPGTYEAQWSPNGQFIAYSSINGVVEFIEWTTGDLVEASYGGTVLDWSSDGSMVTTGLSYDHTLNIVDFSNHQFMTLLTNPDPVTEVNWNPTDTKIAFGDYMGNVRIYDTNTHQLDNVAFTHPSFVIALEWKPDGSQIASVSLDGTLHIWDALNGYNIFTTQVPGGIYSLAWKPDGTQLAYGDENGGVKIIPAPELQSSATVIPPPSDTPADCIFCLGKYHFIFFWHIAWLLHHFQ